MALTSLGNGTYKDSFLAGPLLLSPALTGSFRGSRMGAGFKALTASGQGERTPLSKLVSKSTEFTWFEKRRESSRSGNPGP